MRRPRHLELFHLARLAGAIYPCTCSRRDVQSVLADIASASHEGVAPVYSGHCRHQSSDASRAEIAWRFKMPREDGRDDFIIARTSSLPVLNLARLAPLASLASLADASFTPAYHWACAIDDFDGAYDLIVRSSDLAAALPLQRAVQAWIASAQDVAAPLIRTFHTSLVTHEDGHRLEKRSCGVTLPELFEAGWTPDKILQMFDKTFDRALLASSAFNAFGIGAESRERIVLPLSI